MTYHQFKKVKALVRDYCANYSNGDCFPNDMECPQLQCDTGLCSYFVESVLPLDEKLLLEITRPKEMFTKRCKDCNKIIYSKSKTKQYCEDCSYKRYKAKHRKYNSKRT